MQKMGLGVLKVLAGATALALGCLAIVYSVEIVAFFGDNAMWIIAGLGVWIGVSIVLGLAVGTMLRKPDVRPSAAPPAAPDVPSAPAAPAVPAVPSRAAAGFLDIPFPTSPHDSEQGVALNAPTRTRRPAP